MTKASEESKQPEEPIDKLIAYLTGMVQGLEAKQAKARETSEVPDDVPRFVTRR